MFKSQIFLLKCSIFDIGNPRAKTFPVLLGFISQFTVFIVRGNKWKGVLLKSFVMGGKGGGISFPFQLSDFE